MSDITYKPERGTVWRNPNRPWQLSLIGYFCVVVGYIGIVWKIPSNSKLFLSADFLRKVNPSYVDVPYSAFEYVFVLSMVLIGTIVSLVALAGGIGVLKMREWGRKAILIYATCAIILTLAKCVSSAMRFEEDVQRMIASTTQPVDPEAARRSRATVLVFGTLSQLVAPMAMLTILNRRVIREVFDGRKKGLDQN